MSTQTQRLLGAAVVLAMLLALPHLTSPYFFVQILIRSFWLGTVAASLTFLIRYAGMISLAQTAIYGTAAYVVANFSVVKGMNPWAAAVCAMGIATLVALAIGLISARARGVYFLMITLTAGVFVYYFTLQYRPFTFGFGGINGVPVPGIGSVQFRDPVNFYYLALGVSIVAAACLYAYARAPIGLALQGDRDCPERMTALGLNTTAVRVAGFTVAGLVASAGGVLSVWFNGQVSPGSLDIVRTIDILIIAVLGGVVRIEGAWVGAFLMSVLTVYASDVTDYYNTVIGLVFILVVVFSPEGSLGLATSLGNRISTSLRALPALRRTTPATTASKEN
jgi:branched-chain amino acid transport system permease protein